MGPGGTRRLKTNFKVVLRNISGTRRKKFMNRWDQEGPGRTRRDHEPSNYVYCQIVSIIYIDDVQTHFGDFKIFSGMFGDFGRN